MLARAKDEAIAERARALEAVEQAKRDAQALLQEASVDLATRMAGKIVDRPLDASAVRKHVMEG
jgi:F0F1-type ATP synthase membrane subunit b/b'